MRLSYLSSLAALAIVSPIPAYAQAGVIAGTIADTSGVAIQSVQVYLPFLNLGVLTDTAGRFELTDVPPGDHILYIERIGYATDSLALSVSADTLLVDRRLVPEAFTLGGFAEPQPFDGQLVLSFSEAVWIPSRPELYFGIGTVHEYGISGHRIVVDLARDDHLLTAQVEGIRFASVGTAAMTPASYGAPVYLSDDGIADTLAIEYGSHSDRFILHTVDYGPDRWLEIEEVTTTLTVLAGDRLELVLPGTVRLRCEPTWLAPEECQGFVLRVARSVESARQVDPEQWGYVVFGNTASPGLHDTRGRWLVLRGLDSSGLDEITTLAREFTGEHPDSVNVRLDTWEGELITCFDGKCEEYAPR